jgi:ABC-2 type transport system ATP-binding protein
VATGTDVLLTTHYLDEADELADHVVVIDHGKTVASGTLGSIKASIGQDVIEVALAAPTGLEQVGHLLARVTSGRPRLDRSGRRARASTTNGTADLAAVIQGLSDAAIAVDEIGLRRPTLDEVFLTLTGTDQKGVP